MTTLRDELSEALGKAEAGTLEAPQEVSEVQEPAEEVKAEGRSRDEHGRFAKTDPVPKEDPQPQAAVETRKPPSSWKKDYWDHWGKLDPKIQEYIEQREGDYAKGVSTYKSQWDQAAPVYEAIQPFMPELQQHGIQPGQWIQNLGNAHRTLALGSPEQKLQMFAKLATDYGVPLQGLQGGQQNPQFGHIVQNFQNLQQQVQRMEQQRQQEQQAALQREIEVFSKEHPLFEKAKPIMSQLLQGGVAADLKTAYDKAIRLDDDLWQQHVADQQAKADAGRQASIAKKKAAAVSPKSTSPTGSVVSGGGSKNLRDMLSEAVETHSGGRF